jgi:hypothetical protein
MKVTLRLKGIYFGDKFSTYTDGRSSYPGVDGAVEYEITQELSKEELATKKSITTNPYSFTIYQPFKAGTTSKSNDFNVWAWNGNKDKPTLTPSWLLNWSSGNNPAIRIHLFFTDGKINLLPDSNVQLIS